MSKTIISNCDLTFHDIKKVSLSVDGPFNQSECLEIRFENSSKDSGTLSLFFEPGIKVELESLKPFQKLKKIIVDIGKIRLNKRRKKHGKY